MMTLIMFALHDTKTGMFHAPFFFNHRGAALRAVADLAADLSTVIGRHPADYNLFELGTFDDNTGSTETRLVNLGSVIGLLQPAPTGSLGL